MIMLVVKRSFSLCAAPVGEAVDYFFFFFYITLEPRVE